MRGPNSAQIQGIRGRYLRTKPGLLFGRDRDLETPSTTTSMKNQRTTSSRQKFWVLGRAGLQPSCSRPRLHPGSTQNRKCKGFIGHARVWGSPATHCVSRGGVETSDDLEHFLQHLISINETTGNKVVHFYFHLV